MVNIFDIELGNLFLHDGGILRVDSMNRLQEGIDPFIFEKEPKVGGGFRYSSANGSQLDPLPPTKDLLRQLGFEKSGDVMYHSVKKEISVKYYRVDGWVIKRYDQDILSFKSINELQNLFYHLTKTKLTLCK